MEKQSSNPSPSKLSEADNAAPAQPIKNTKIRRALTVAATWVAVRTRYSIGFIGARISPGLMVKRGVLIRLEEANNQEFIRKNTQVPVPKVYCAFTRKGCTYIVMEFIRGKTLHSWWQTASEESKESVRRQLAGYMDMLRKVSNPTPGRIGGLNGGPIYDDRYTAGKGEGPYSPTSFGPFHDAHEFHLWLRNGWNAPPLSEMGEVLDRDAEIYRMCRIQDRRDYTTKVTHGDFSSSNIIIRDNKVAGIIDWEMAGWYPDYWEYTSAWHVNIYDEFWRAEVNDIMDSHEYEEELEAEKTRHRYFQSP